MVTGASKDEIRKQVEDQRESDKQRDELLATAREKGRKKQ